MPLVSLPEWQDYQASHPDLHLLQTAEWGELKRAFGWEPFRLIRGDAGAQILLRRLLPGISLAYAPKLPPALLREDSFIEEIDSLCRARGAAFLKIEPDAWDDFSIPAPRGARPAPTIQPRRTIVVDISSPEEEILARMKQKTRYNIRLAARKGVSVRAWEDVDAFHEMMMLTGGRDGFGVHSLEYYRRAYTLFHDSDMAELLVAEYEGTPLAALMIFARGRRAWYFYGASSNERRNLMPAYLLQWEAIRWAKARGCTEYDLWGVPDFPEEDLEAHFTERREGLWGVYRFKRGFGGTLKRSAAALDKPYRPFLYRLYRWLK
jgi:lipid II:glycine glycyltransferase (peptidoglycan interpeptide bridge formation enzyme)